MDLYYASKICFTETESNFLYQVLDHLEGKDLEIRDPDDCKKSYHFIKKIISVKKTLKYGTLRHFKCRYTTHIPKARPNTTWMCNEEMGKINRNNSSNCNLPT